MADDISKADCAQTPLHHQQLILLNNCLLNTAQQQWEGREGCPTFLGDSDKMCHQDPGATPTTATL